MRRKVSDELPRYVGASSRPNSRWSPNVRIYIVIGLVLFYWLFLSGSRKPQYDATNSVHVDWSRYAYSLYATDSATLCHAVMIFDALARHGSKADRVLFYPEYWDTVIESSSDRDSQLLVIARDRYKVKLQPTELLSVEGLRTPKEPSRTWDKSVTKFLAFSLEYYDRVIALDSDITLLQSLDNLFLTPSTPMAMPRAYWYDTKPWPLTSLLMVLQPSLAELEYFKTLISGGAAADTVRKNKFDMELLNDRFGESAMVLPHRPYALLSGEFRSKNHTTYLGSTTETWDAEKVYKEAKLVHFSDWPLPKPWIMWPHDGLAEMQPDCDGAREGSCTDRRIWKGLYDDFRQRRKDICAYLSVPAPEWSRIKAGLHHEIANETEGTHHEAPHVEGRDNIVVEETSSAVHAT